MVLRSPKSVALWLLPIALGIGGLVPVVDMLLFSGHGGVGWFLLPFAIPIAVIGTVRARTSVQMRHRRAVIIVGTALSMLLLFLAEAQIREWSGLEMPLGLLPGLAALPLGIPFVAWGLVAKAGA